LPEAKGESMVLNADIKGVCVSSGSACHNGIIEPSQVLKAVGLSNNEALGSLRISAGALTTEEECIGGAEILSQILSSTKRKQSKSVH
jgi:cysteine desulfurase